jgi:hypothetical protein
MGGFDKVLVSQLNILQFATFLHIFRAQKFDNGKMAFSKTSVDWFIATKSYSERLVNAADCRHATCILLKMVKNNPLFF